MVFLADGRFELPDNLFYASQTHIFIDLTKRILGIDQILIQSLKQPIEIKNRIDSATPLNIPQSSEQNRIEIAIGQHIADIIHGEDREIIKIHSPCRAIYQSFNENAIDYLENDTYTHGYLFRFEEILEIADKMITGKQIEPWAQSEIIRMFELPVKMKVMLLGDPKVGKTSIKNRYCDNFFTEEYNPTLGVDFGAKKFRFLTEQSKNPDKEKTKATNASKILQSKKDSVKIDLTLWEVAGEPEMKELIGMYMLDTKGVFLVCDISNPDSIKNIDDWFEELEMNIGVRFPIIILINKSENLYNELKISNPTEHIFNNDGFSHPNIGIIKEIMKKHVDREIPIYFISAKTGDGVEEAFKHMISSILSSNDTSDDDY